MITSYLCNGVWINTKAAFNSTKAVAIAMVGEVFTTSKGFMVKSSLLKEITNDVHK
tara:strand:+ start:250 stop:417 length:168 start_codon:yes stop_codon:yes gene_type:complete